MRQRISYNRKTSVLPFIQDNYCNTAITTCNAWPRKIAMTNSLNEMDAMEENPVPKLYLSGYLTIKDYNREFLYYTLGFPNKEVE